MGAQEQQEPQEQQELPEPQSENARNGRTQDSQAPDDPRAQNDQPRDTHAPNDQPHNAPAPDAPSQRADGVRFALGTLTVLPVAVHRWDRRAARSGMLCAPLAGLAVGVLSAVVGVLLLVLGASPLLAAVAAVAGPAVLTRGLHLDGLADVADGLGSGKPADDALRIMKRSDIGPFGVVTLLLVLMGQVAAVAELFSTAGPWYGAFGIVAAAVAGRTALTLASRQGVPAARPEGLGAAVAGTVPVRAAYAVAAAVAVLVAAAAAGVSPYGAAYGPVHAAAATVLALCASELALRHCRRRFGGVTGDVFGALAETAATVALVVLALA